MPHVDATDQTFQQEVLDVKGTPVLVDFWAEWCYPCKAQAPILDQIATDLGGKMKLVKLEVDDNPNTGQQFNVLSIPTLVIFKDGKMVWQGVGVHQKGVLEAEINKHL